SCANQGGWAVRAPSPRADDALRGRARQPRDVVRRDRGRRAGSQDVQARAQRAGSVSGVRTALPRLRAAEVQRVRREPPGGVFIQGPRILPILFGPADVRDGGGSDRASTSAGGSAPVGVDVPVCVGAYREEGAELTFEPLGHLQTRQVGAVLE